MYAMYELVCFLILIGKLSPLFLTIIKFGEILIQESIIFG